MIDPRFDPMLVEPFVGGLRPALADRLDLFLRGLELGLTAVGVRPFDRRLLAEACRLDHPGGGEHMGVMTSGVSLPVRGVDREVDRDTMPVGASSYSRATRELLRFSARSAVFHSASRMLRNIPSLDAD